MGDGASQSWGAKNRNKQWLSIQKQVTIKSFGMSHQMAWKQLLFVSEIHAKIKSGCQFSYFISKFAWKRTDVEPFPGVSTYLRGWFLDHKPLECHSRTSNIINLHFLSLLRLMDTEQSMSYMFLDSICFCPSEIEAKRTNRLHCRALLSATGCQHLTIWWFRNSSWRNEASI